MKFLRALTLILVLLGGLGVGGWIWILFEMEAPSPSETSTVIVIEPGTSSKAIAAQLAHEGLIKHPLFFLLYLKGNGTHATLQAGEYEIPPHSSTKSLIEKLSSGDVVKHSITIPEGLTSHQIVELLNADTDLSGIISNLPAEGTLLPETYNFLKGESRTNLLTRMQNAQTQLLDELWNARAETLPYKTKEEALILASIVEKETGISDERARVAGVFVNRLRIPMRLQSDPTVSYGITLGKEPLNRPLTRADLKTPTPYNTYVIDRLPPTPIANPGKASLHATFHPRASTELYFVVDGNGGHRFASTLKEHNRNVMLARTRASQPSSE